MEELNEIFKKLNMLYQKRNYINCSLLSINKELTYSYDENIKTDLNEQLSILSKELEIIYNCINDQLITIEMDEVWISDDDS
jgi:hypothetical protein